MSAARALIVNADDFGHSEAVDAGVIEAHERGIVTAASLMVRRPNAEAAAAYARRSDLDVGLHVELGEWRHDEQQGWVAVYETEASDVRGDVARQLERFERLVGRPPTHLDSHQHVHREEPALAVFREVAARLRVPLRQFTPEIAFNGGFYGQDDEGRPYPEHVSPRALIALLRSLPPGVTELCCHPGRGQIPGSSYGSERELELVALCDPDVARTVATEQITLTGFAEVSPRLVAGL